LLTAVALTAGLGLALVATPRLPHPAFASDPGGQGWLGVQLQELTPDLRETLSINRRVNGALVSYVVPDSPAEVAGLQQEDVTTEIQGTRLTTVEEAVEAVQNLAPGEKVLITVNRSGRTRALTAVLGDREEARAEGRYDQDVRRHYGQIPEPPRPPRPPRAPRPPVPPSPPHVEIHRLSGGYLGVQTFALNDQLAEYFGVPTGRGVLVLEVVEESPAGEAGLQAGDVILSVGEVEIEGPRDLRRAIRSQEPGETVGITVTRKGTTQTFEVTLGDAHDMSDRVIFGGNWEELADLEVLEDLDLPDIEVLLEDLPGLEAMPEHFEWHGDGHGPRIYFHGDDGVDWKEINEEVREQVLESLKAARQQMDRVRIQVRGLQGEHMDHLHEQLNRLREKEELLREVAPESPVGTGTI